MDSESDVRHDRMQAAGAIRPSLPFTAMAFQCGTGVRFGSLRLQAPSVLHCHGVSVWRGGPLGSLGSHAVL